MTITIDPGSTVLFTGDSITDCQRGATDNALGYGYPSRVAGAWGVAHSDKPVTFVNTGIAGNRVSDLQGRWQHDVLDLDLRQVRPQRRGGHDHPRA